MDAMMQGDLSQSISVTIVGMGLVFASLGLLMLIIAGLQRVFRERPVAPSSRPMGLEAGKPFVVEENEEEIVAAIAVAIEVLRRREQALPPPQTTVVTFAPGASAWQASGRLS